MKLNKNIIGWIFYDFANQGYVTLIVSVVFSVYYKNVVVGEAEYGTFMWSLIVAISMLLVGVTAPLFGAIADYSGSKKTFLFINSYICIFFTALLYFTREGTILLASLFFIISNFGYNSGNVFYNSFLTEITSRKNIGKVSGWGWAFGYVGGLISLLIAFPLINIDVKLVFPMVSVFFLVFSIITFILLKEKKNVVPKKVNYLRVALNRINYTLRNISRFNDLLRFLISFFIYHNGIVVVYSFAAIYGDARFGMTSGQLIMYFVYAQLTSIPGAFVFGYVLDKIGSKKTILITISIWIVVVIGAFLISEVWQYYIIGLIAGIAMGSSQSSSRAMLAQLTPKSKMTEFFGFYGLNGKLTAILGPIVFGSISVLTGSQRLAILSVLIFFIGGGLLLLTVNEERGKRVACDWQDDGSNLG